MSLTTSRVDALAKLERDSDKLLNESEICQCFLSRHETWRILYDQYVQPAINRAQQDSERSQDGFQVGRADVDVGVETDSLIGNVNKGVVGSGK